MLTKPVIAAFISVSLSLLGFLCGTDRPATDSHQESSSITEIDSEITDSSSNSPTRYIDWNEAWLCASGNHYSFEERNTGNSLLRRNNSNSFLRRNIQSFVPVGLKSFNSTVSLYPSGLFSPSHNFIRLRHLII